MSNEGKLTMSEVKKLAGQVYDALQAEDKLKAEVVEAARAYVRLRRGVAPRMPEENLNYTQALIDCQKRLYAAVDALEAERARMKSA